MYEGLVNDCESDQSLLMDIERAKSHLESFYRLNYQNRVPSTGTSRATSAKSKMKSSFNTNGYPSSPEKVNFTSRYVKKDRVVVNELEEFFKLPREDFDSCKPLQWWIGRRSQFPNLYNLVCDVFSIPGQLNIILDLFLY